MRQRRGFAISAAAKALELGRNLSVKNAYTLQLKRQIEALELFVICATARANYQLLSNCAEKLRAEDKRDSDIEQVKALLESEIKNAGRLISYLESDSVKSFLLPEIADVQACIQKINEVSADPATAAGYWITTK